MGGTYAVSWGAGKTDYWRAPRYPKAFYGFLFLCLVSTVCSSERAYPAVGGRDSDFVHGLVTTDDIDEAGIKKRVAANKMTATESDVHRIREYSLLNPPPKKGRQEFGLK